MNITSTSNNIFNNPAAFHGPRKYMELVNDIPNQVHKKLYDTAIEKLIDDLDNYTDVNEVINKTDDESWNDIIISIKEIPYSEYWRASDVIITFKYYIDVDGKKIPKLKRFTFDLEPYWGNCYTKDTTSATDVKYDKNIANDTEIVKYDYVRGKATIRNKLDDIEYEVDFDELNYSDVESDDLKLPIDTFTSLAKINV